MAVVAAVVALAVLEARALTRLAQRLVHLREGAVEAVRLRRRW